MTLDSGEPEQLPKDGAKPSPFGPPVPQEDEQAVAISPFGPPQEASQLSHSSAETVSGDEDSALSPETHILAAADDASQPGEYVTISDAPAEEPSAGDRVKGYPELAAIHFGEHFAHRLRWAHAVNSRRRLRGALAASAHFLEADVAAGPLLEPRQELAPAPAAPHPRLASARSQGTRLRTARGESIIMAHYPTEQSSDLSLERFMNAVLRHNDRLAVDGELPEAHISNRAAATPSVPQRRSRVSQQSVGTNEAEAFARDLNKELDAHASSNGHMITACVGSRRDRPLVMTARRTFKGVKLDFKLFDCVEPTINFLREIDAARKLGGHLWLNADVFAGPGALISPLSANDFVRICAEKLPEAVLSLSWGASIISTTRLYTREMVERMIELCMSPIVQQPLACPSPVQVPWPEEGPDDEQCGSGGGGGDARGGVFLAPAATSHHITFAVAAEYALSSSDGLRRLLESVPGSSLTIFSGVGSLGITPAHVQDLINTYGERRCFLDLRVSKPWRSCTNSSCAVH